MVGAGPKKHLEDRAVNAAETMTDEESLRKSLIVFTLCIMPYHVPGIPDVFLGMVCFSQIIHPKLSHRKAGRALPKAT